jgi:TrmH family RNA methyltransferase
VQRLRRLASRRTARWEAGRFVAEGPKLLDEALRAGAPVEDVYLDQQGGDEVRDLAERARQAGAAVHEVAAGVLERACDAATPQPLAAIVAMGHVPLESLPSGGMTLVAVGVQDPGNAGAVIRSAAASGTRAVVFCTGAVDIYSPKTVRASAGAIFHIPITTGVGPADALRHLGDAGVARLATVARGGRDYSEVDWTGPCALVLGNESHGLPESAAAMVDGHVTIPMRPAIESLNVAMAATVICFEAERQRRSLARGAA